MKKDMHFIIALVLSVVNPIGIRIIAERIPEHENYILYTGGAVTGIMLTFLILWDRIMSPKVNVYIQNGEYENEE